MEFLKDIKINKYLNTYKLLRHKFFNSKMVNKTNKQFTDAIEHYKKNHVSNPELYLIVVHSKINDYTEVSCAFTTNLVKN
jgi:hypothetical protein